MLTAVVGDDVLLELSLADGDAGSFPQAKVYNAAGAVAATVNLSPVADGLYHGTFLGADNSVIGQFSVHSIVYQDAGHTIVANKYDRVSEDLVISSPEGGAA